MSIIQTIRDKGSWVIFTLLTLSLIAFIFMDANRRSSIFGGGRSDSIGSVNGKSIKGEVYNSRVDALRKIYSSNERITEDQITNYVWNSLVNEKLMAKELDKLSFKMSDKELVDFAFGKYGNPNQHIIPFFNHYFPGSQLVNETGQLNQEGAKQVYNTYLKNGASSPDNTVAEMSAVFKTLLGMVKTEFLMQKFGTIMGNTSYIPSWMAKKQMAENNTLANISYVHLPYTDLSDSLPELKVSDEEVLNYMKKRESMYKQNESRVVDYAQFDYTATRTDSLDIMNTLSAKKVEFRNTPDSLAGNYVTSNSSATPYDPRFFRKKDLTIPADSGSGYVKGAVYGPYLDMQSRYTLAKIAEVKQLPDSVSCRHVLISIADPRQNRLIREESAAKLLIDSVVKLYQQGMPFDTLAKRFSEDPGSKDNGGLYKSVGLNQFVPEFNDFIFTKNVGDTAVIRTDYGYHFVQIMGQKGAFSPAYKVAYLAREIGPSQVTRDSAMDKARSFAAECRTAKAFDDYFVKNPGVVNKLTSREVTKDVSSVDMFNKARDLVKWMYNAKPGDVSEPIIMEEQRKILVAKLSTVNAEGLQDVKKARVGIESIIRNDKKYDLLAKKYSGSSLEEIATKAGKQVVVKDSVSYESGQLGGIGMGAEPRVAGATLNTTYQSKISGPIKGISGVFFIKVNGQPYAKAGANNDAEAVRAQMMQQAKQTAYSAEQAYRKDAKIKDKRLERN